MTTAIRVCFVTGAYPPAVCGVGDYTASLCGALAKQGLEVSIVTSSYLGIPRQESGNPKIFPIIKSWHLHQARNAMRAICQTEPDVVVFQIPHLEYRRRILCNLLIPLVKACRPSARIVVTFHEMIEPRDLSWKRALNLGRVIVSVACADAVAVVAPAYRYTFQAVVHKVWPWSRRVPLYVIPVASSIPPSALGPDELRRLRERMGFSNGSRLLTYFGFINADKGFDDALNVVSRLCHRRFPARLLVIGRFDPSDPYHRAMEQRIVRDGLDRHVTITGFLEAREAADHLAMSDAAILPFRKGLHPKSTTFLAARAQGVFTITTSTGSTGYSDEENVYYARPGDIEAMADAVCRYAGKRLPSRNVRKPPDWTNIADRYREVFRDLVSMQESQ